ncbi:MAG: DNA polymerase III subunit delta' [Desulfobacter sp.]|nr:MAG: DNA polymerase III subunit delta' [Desulfobacter sp.]
MQEFGHPPEPTESHPEQGPEPGPLPQLRQLIRTLRIPNALLFYGAGGTGKKEAALEFVKSCNCSTTEALPCNSCISCKKINTGMHPDMIFLGPEENKKNITIAQIREMGRMISVRPNEADYRMVCIQDAGLMNVQAQNGLLKVLEEPPEKTFFILLAEGTSTLLPTILSRCRKFRFRPMPPEQIREILCTDGAIEQELARIIALTQGPDLDRALDFARNGGSWKEEWAGFRKWLIQSVLDLTSGPARTRMAKGLDLSQKLSSDPDLAASARAVIRTVLRDLCVFRYSPEQIVNLDFFDGFKDISGKHVYPTFLEWLTAFTETEKRLDSNSGPRLALDQFFLELSLS